MAISIKALRAAFPRQSDETIASIRAALVAFERREINRDRALHEINMALDAHGVESVPHPNGSDYGHIADYVNTGDTYNATILFSHRSARFYLTTWGDWYERTPEYKAYSRAEYRRERAQKSA